MIFKLSSILTVLMCAPAAYAFSPSSTIQSRQYAKSTTTSSTTTTTTTTTTLQMASETKGPFDFLSGLFPNDNNQVSVKEPKIPDVVIDPSYDIAIAFAAVGVSIVLLTQGSVYGAVQGGITLLFASFLAVQASRIRFVFDGTCFELKNTSSSSSSDEEELASSGENFVVGGENRWRYDSFVNYDFFPSRGLPILVYFKENQTPEELWSEGPGGLDKVGGGQLHFFPAIANVDQLKEQFALRGCAKVEE
jgi:hypothetical protein